MGASVGSHAAQYATLLRPMSYRKSTNGDGFGTKVDSDRLVKINWDSSGLSLVNKRDVKLYFWQ
ncbi:MAG: hypothetical protein EXR90_06310 [Methyloglobulus sp.]|nr:hypothetical protein [Methyloglobulus sp.]